jgi:hypothetical protein
VDARQRQALGGVGVPLGVEQHLLVGPPSGSLHPGGQPVHRHRLAGACHLHQPLAQVVEAGDEGSVRLAVPERGCRPPRSWRSRPCGQHGGTTTRPAARLRRRPGAPPAAAAGCRPARAGWSQVGQTAGQPGQHLGGQRRTRAGGQGEPDLHCRLSIRREEAQRCEQPCLGSDGNRFGGWLPSDLRQLVRRARLRDCRRSAARHRSRPKNSRMSPTSWSGTAMATMWLGLWLSDQCTMVFLRSASRRIPGPGWEIPVGTLV